eukprot:2107519-Alexandrium_andersonii.AAC.1
MGGVWGCWPSRMGTTHKRTTTMDRSTQLCEIQGDAGLKASRPFPRLGINEIRRTPSVEGLGTKGFGPRSMLGHGAVSSHSSLKRWPTNNNCTKMEIRQATPIRSLSFQLGGHLDRGGRG